MALGSSGSWSKRPCWRAKLNNHSFLKYAEAAPSSKVLGIGYSICPSSVWLNWKCMELRVWFFFCCFFLMEVNSCLTILPSDVYSRELGQQTTAWGMHAEGLCCCGRGSSIHSYLIRRPRLQHQSPVLGRDLLLRHLLQRPRRERCICLCTTVFISALDLNMMYSHLQRAVLVGWNTCCISRKRNNNIWEKTCFFW